MSIRIGDLIPDVKLRRMTAEGARPVDTAEVFADRRVVLFAVPGAFTRTCSDTHLPGYQVRAAQLKEAGVDAIVCVAVNDVFVMDAWSKARGVGDDILMLADGNGDFARAMGLEVDLSEFGFGVRSQRYAAVVEDGVVRKLEIETGPGVTVSAAEEIFDWLSARARQGSPTA